MRISDWSSDVCSSDLGLRGCRPGCFHCCADFGIRRIPPQREAAVYLKHLAGHEALVRGDPHGRIGDVITRAHPAKRIFLGESVENRLIRSAERRVGKEGGRTFRSRGSPYLLKKKKKQ